MNEKLKIFDEEREGIIKSYSKKPLKNKALEEANYLIKDEQYVYVKQIIDETPDTKSFILAFDKDRGTTFLLPFKSGEYISLKLDINGQYTTRAYSLSSSPKEVEKGFYRITVKKQENGLVSSYLYDEIKLGDKLTISHPTGNFGYQDIRDEDNVIGIAGGSGISPFMSLAKSIMDGIYNCHLTVFYSVKKEEDIIFKEEIEEINKKNKNVKFIITLTREENEKYLHGHINKEMMDPYMSEFNTVLMCGPKGLYESMNHILNEFSLSKKNVHYENYYFNYTPIRGEKYNLKVLAKNEEISIPCYSDQTLLVAMEKEGFKAPSLCRIGSCGFCRSILIEGKLKMIGGIMTNAEKGNNYIHPCISYPESDIIIKLDF